MAETNETANDCLLLFDGVCNLCNSSVRFFVRRDPRKNLRFAPLQSATGQRILKERGLPTDHLSSIVFVERDHAHLHSSAILRACGYLRFSWPAVKVFLVIPCFLRNWVYRWIARNRYRWFGTTEDCPVPRPEDADRFI